MDPWKIPPEELISKGILIEISREITIEEYHKIYSDYAITNMNFLGVGIPNKTFFFSPESLNRLYERITILVEERIQKKIETLRLKLKHFIITAEQKQDFANRLIEKHSKEYLQKPNFERWLSEERLAEGEGIRTVIKDLEESGSYMFSLFTEPSRWKEEMANDEDLFYYAVNNEYNELSDYDLYNSFFYKNFFQISMDRGVLEFVKEEVLLEPEKFDQIIGEYITATTKSGIDGPKMLLLLDEYGIIDYLMNAYEGITANKVGNMLAPILGEAPNTIGRLIRTLKAPLGIEDKNNPNKNTQNEIWVESFLKVLKLPPKKI